VQPGASGDHARLAADVEVVYPESLGDHAAGVAAIPAPAATDAQALTMDKVPEPSHGSDRRSESRRPVQAPVELYASGGLQSAELHNISLSGAFIATHPVTLAQGAGLRIEFTLPQGFHVNVFGRIVWARTVDSHEEPAGYGVQFFGLDDLNREFIQYHLDLVKNGDASPVFRGQIQTRFEVSAEGDDRLLIRMSGTLTPVESEGLEEVVCRRLPPATSEPCFVYIDARDLGPCSRAALEHIRNWLDRLCRNRQVLGVLVGTNTIGVVQLRRLIREARLADGLMVFAEEAEAQAFWRTLVSSEPVLG
jgi:hypothetical protein